MSLIKCVVCPNPSGTVEKDGKLYECMCATLRRIGASMPPYIRKATVTPEHTRLPIVRNPGSQYYVISSWSDIQAIIKLVMILNPNKVIKITSDREIRDVYVGNKSAKSLGENSDAPIYNSLEDLVESPYLVIIRLNELHYKNKAASGALAEAISIRLDRDRPIWVLNNRNNPFGKGSMSWSTSVDDLLTTGFNYVNVPQINVNADNEYAPINLESQSDKKLISAPSLNRSKRAAPILELTPIDDDQAPEPLEEPAEEPAPKHNRLKIDVSGVEEDDNPLSQYGSGLKKKFRRNQ